MTSQLKVDKLQGRTTAGSITVTSEGTSVETNLQQGLCKAWSNVDENQSTIHQSFNISGLTDAGTGLCTHAFTNGFSADPFTDSAHSIHQTNSTGFSRMIQQNSTTSIQTDVRNTSNSARDDTFTMMILGALA